MKLAKVRKSSQIGVNLGRAAFWKYCVCAESATRHRAAKLGVEHAIDNYFIDGLFVDQQWRCAVSGIIFTPPGRGAATFREPFAPSLDRIDCNGGYVPGNLRLVCNIVNYAINEWGMEPLMKLSAALEANRHKHRRGRPPLIQRRLKAPHSGSRSAATTLPADLK